MFTPLSDVSPLEVFHRSVPYLLRHGFESRSTLPHGESTTCATDATSSKAFPAASRLGRRHKQKPYYEIRIAFKPRHLTPCFVTGIRRKRLRRIGWMPSEAASVLRLRK